MSDHDSMTDLAAICEEVGRMLYDFDSHQSCITGSALLTKVLHCLEYSNAYPLTVRVKIFNRAFQEWVHSNGGPKHEASAAACEAAGGFAITVGKGAEVSADQWAGHLAVVVPKCIGDRHALCDLTIEQANRPEWEIELPSLMCLKVNDDFAAGKRPFQFEVNGSLVIYEAFPDDHSYSIGRNWLAIGGIDEAASCVISRLRWHECP